MSHPHHLVLSIQYVPFSLTFFLPKENTFNVKTGLRNGLIQWKQGLKLQQNMKPGIRQWVPGLFIIHLEGDAGLLATCQTNIA